MNLDTKHEHEQVNTSLDGTTSVYTMVSKHGTTYRHDSAATAAHMLHALQTHTRLVKPQNAPSRQQVPSARCKSRHSRVITYRAAIGSVVTIRRYSIVAWSTSRGVQSQTAG